MKKLFVPLLTLLLSISVFSQDAGTNGTKSTSNEAAVTIYKRLAKEVAMRSGRPDDLTTLARTPIRIVFLQDISRSSAQADYVDFTRNFCSRFLTQLGKAQSQARIAPVDRALISYFPYQHDLYKKSHVIRDMQLRPGAGVVDLVASTIPNQTIKVPGKSSLGHNSSGSRRQLIELISNTPNLVIVQITPSTLNEDPDNPSNERKIKRVDARTGELDFSNIVPYGDIDTPFQTESKPLGPSQDVHIWLYGPTRFEGNLLASDSKSGRSNQESAKANVPSQIRRQSATRSTGGSAIPSAAAIVLLIVGIGLAIYRFLLKSATIDLNGVRKQVSGTKPLKIGTEASSGGEQASSGGNVWKLSPEQMGTLSPGLDLAEITLAGFFGEPQIKPIGGVLMKVPTTQKLSVLLDSKATSIVFEVSSEKKSQELSVKLINL
jgi:hypothetical protein